MDGLSLLLRAVDAGMNVEAVDGTLVVAGPVRCEELARELLAAKDGVVVAVESGIGPVFAAWPEDARNHYIERLGVAVELDMDVGPGSVAEGIARREAARVTADVPITAWPEVRDAGPIDAALSAFEGLGLRFGGFLDEPPPPPLWPDSPSSLS